MYDSVYLKRIISTGEQLSSKVFVPKNDSYLIKKKLKEIINMPDEEKKKITDEAFEFAKNYMHKKIIIGYLQMFNELIKKYNSRKNLLNN